MFHQIPVSKKPVIKLQKTAWMAYDADGEQIMLRLPDGRLFGYFSKAVAAAVARMHAGWPEESSSHTTIKEVVQAMPPAAGQS